MKPFKAYFNHAGLSRPVPAVLDRMRSAEREYGGHLFSEHGIRMYLDMLAECRRAVAIVLGVDGPRGVSVLANATTALQIALSAIGASLSPGDIVVTSDQEHPCVIRPLNLLARRGIEIVQIKAGSESEFLGRLEVSLRRRPAFVVLSHVSYKNGRILPVRAIGQMLATREILYIVDGAQAFGHIPLDVPATCAWAYVFSGHKWIAGPWGAGGMWVNEAFTSLDRFTLINWERDNDPPDGGRYEEGGTMNYGILAGLAEACRLYTAERDDRFQALTQLREEIGDRIAGIFTDAASAWADATAPGILARLMPPDVSSLKFCSQMLDNYGVAVKPFPPSEVPDAVRISFSPTTTAEEINLLASAMAATAHTLI